MNNKSIEKITTNIAKIRTPLRLVSGKTLPQYDLKYETYGELNEKNRGSNSSYEIIFRISFSSKKFVNPLPNITPISGLVFLVIS